MSLTQPGAAACVHAGSPLTKARPAGVIVIIIVYWAMTAPQLAQWHNSLTAILHAAITAVTVQLGLRAGRVAGRGALVMPVAVAAGIGVFRSNASGSLRQS